MDAVAYLCGHLADIRWQLERQGDVAVLDQLLDAVKSGGDTDDLLRQLHDALQAGGDPLGVYGHLRGGVSRTLGDFPAGAPRESLYLCPHRRCTRYAWPDAGEAPMCDVDGDSMSLELL